ncbi:MAG: hypothetical protein IPJ79_00125 [Bacteroidetes bacterium]|nr:hypothetical protein [Bacteroidota bacterium]
MHNYFFHWVEKEAIGYLNKAFENNHQQNDLTIELWFYRYAHLPEYLKEAEKKIEELLSQSIRSIHWNFDGNIAQAIKDKHPNPEKLKEFAKEFLQSKSIIQNKASYFFHFFLLTFPFPVLIPSLALTLV